jgi:hypothetical protein
MLPCWHNNLVAELRNTRLGRFVSSNCLSEPLFLEHYHKRRSLNFPILSNPR